MLDIPAFLAKELSAEPWQIKNTIGLINDGGTVPFIARYRKEKTGGLDEVVLRTLNDRFQYLTELEDRKQAIIKSIDEQGKLTDELKKSLEQCTQKAELEDLYLPYKPRRRTRATKARESGLEPLAEWIKEQNESGQLSRPLEEAAAEYVNEENGVATPEDALQGAADIIAEEISEKAPLRAYIRDYIYQNSLVVSRIKDEFEEGSTQFENYRDFKKPVKEMPAHNMLALRRGESEGVLFFDMEFDEDHVREYIGLQEIKSTDPVLTGYYKTLIEDAFKRLMRNTLVGEIRLQLKEEADLESIKTFAANLRELLLSSPAGLRPTLGIDPGFRTGCKIAVLDRTGKYLEYTPVFPHSGAGKKEEAKKTVLNLIKKYEVELIAIGNGTAGRETDQFITEIMKDLETTPTKVLVNEAGASVYSASPLAVEEFPDLDVTVRGAISIGRRLQDPLAELVKIDPKSIGVGQYQHDVDQSMLRQKLEETVESCVNFVGVNLNTASKELLQFTAGITPSLAKNIVAYRDENGLYKQREQLMKVPRFGPKAYEQAAGFLRIPGGSNPLDNTAVHPERYDVVEAMSKDLGVELDTITKVPDQLESIRLKKYVRDDLGMPTLQDIVEELKKPGLDPRSEFTYATFRDDVNDIKDLQTGMILEGSVTNVTNFGAFVDIGVHRDGLVHISQLADRYVSDPTEVVKVGQVVKVRVTEINEKLKRIGLSMRLEDKPRPSKPKNKRKGGEGKPRKRKPEKKHATIEDLMRKFNSK
ncbi:MAG: RNA-binding transcriptional accessory protein [Rhodothermaceae bacterium]|nr:RNA-binding transcriptional accessory protein [Rhodothermaceae bacterium]